MSASLNYYEASFIMRSKEPSMLRVVDLWGFKSKKSNKRYIVEVEYFSNHFLGLKFYWKGVGESKNRYSFLTNDYEPRTIVMSCVHIMLHYYKKDRFASFGFVAAEDFKDRMNPQIPNRRFRFYRAMMLSLFGSETFAQGYDLNNSLYLLINRAMLDGGEVDISDIEYEISNLYRGDYSIVVER